MTAADQGGPSPDLYQLLGVSRRASREEIALAWRHRARDEHPDARPADAGAAGRFRALAEAWQVLGDPARRAAYDRAIASDQQATGPAPAAPVRIPVRHLRESAGGQPLRRAAAPPLWAGPVRVQHPSPETPVDARVARVRPVTLAEFVLRYLGGRW